MPDVAYEKGIVVHIQYIHQSSHERIQEFGSNLKRPEGSTPDHINFV